MAKALSETRQRILRYIEDHIRDTGYPPTVREIGKGVQLKSASTVHTHLKKLEDGGFIARTKNQTRAIRSTHGQASFPVTNVPVVGRVAAGHPILADEEIQGQLGVPSDMLSDYEGFLLEVKGDSMVDLGIYDRDYVVVRRQGTADDGDVVVAMIDDEATVKSLYREDGRFRLQPANDKYEPLYSDNVTLVGKVVGLFRRMA